MTETPVSTNARRDARRGFAFGLSAYVLWGLQPIYIKAGAHIPAAEVLAHRILWALPVAGAVLLLMGRTADLRVALRSPRTLAMATLTACIIALNWGVYVWAVAVGRAMDASLGYFINPLLSVVMGAVLLGERLTRAQIAAVALAACAVLMLTVDAGAPPLVPLFLAGTFAVYGYLRKTLPIGPSQGLFLELTILFLPALAYVIWLQREGISHFVTAMPLDMAILIGFGPATAAPLLLYGFGARLLRLSTIGIMQYASPTLIFLNAVFLFGEPFGGVKALAFLMIWIALAIYTWSMLRTLRGA